MNNTDKAIKYFSKNFNCSQSVFASYSEKFGITEKDAFKIASGFGGGIGKTQNICGALSGAVMVLSCRYYNENDIRGSKILVYEKVKELILRFKEIHNTIDCLELIDLDFNKDGSSELFNKLKIRENKCNGYINDVCKILEELI